jgi:2-polyprenyl-3-methyl-5-hydroxy-6-metoxy-1,4-benzoquinol methylase
VLDLGRTPIANALAEPAAAASDALRFPLGVQLCASCSLVQVTHDLPAAVIFDGSYPYYSAYSSTVVARAERFARELVKARELDPRSLVMEIGSNDGYLLRHLRRAGIGVLGVDPAAGPGAAAAALGVPTVQDFFGEELAHALRRDHGQADVVVANNVLAHVPDINDFVAGIAEVLAPGGVVTIENPSVRTMVDQLAFDTIYHEHFSYLSTHAVERLFARHGLQLNHVDTLPEVHGGSLRWHLSRSPGRSAEARRVLADEAAVGVGEPRFYAGLEARVAQAQRNLRSFVADVRGKGLRIAAYGATAKGATLLNTTGLTSSDIEFVVDKNPAKQHKVIPGCGVPIRSPEALLQSRPDYALLLAWNLADEIIAEQRAYLAAGGRFVLPVTPDLTPAILKDSARP